MKRRNSIHGKHTEIAKYKALMPTIQHVSLLISEHISGVDASVQYHAVFDIDDTLIFDDNRQTPNVQVRHLLDVARAHGLKIHLVTARERSAEVSKWTRDELRRHGIHYESLALAPKKARESMKDVSAWKHSERDRHKPVVISVGDQWGDLVLLEKEEDIIALDAHYNTRETPWVIMKPNDGVTVYGIKLFA